MPDEKVAFVYWCDGAGHAARSIPVLKELESRGIDVSVAGGGPGKKFVQMNGFEHPDLEHVAVKGDGVFSFLKHTIFDLIPSSVKRFKQVHGWLKDEDPDKVVTDDIFTAISCSIQGIEFYRIDHLTPGLFGPVWGILLKIYNSASLVFADQIIVTSLWKEAEDPKGITRVGPLAQEGESDDEIEEYDVLINPGTHGENFDKIKNQLEDKGLDVRQVGDDNWKTKPAMTPYTEKADVVICTGFSSIADTVVAGTPCIIYPFLPFQKALADRVEDENLKGLAKANSVDEVVEEAENFCNGSREAPDYDNGASEFVDVLLEE